jgi:hypothetical protein
VKQTKFKAFNLLPFNLLSCLSNGVTGFYEILNNKYSIMSLNEVFSKLKIVIDGEKSDEIQTEYRR